jgi:hypothetical protein
MISRIPIVQKNFTKFFLRFFYNLEVLKVEKNANLKVYSWKQDTLQPFNSNKNDLEPSHYRELERH